MNAFLRAILLVILKIRDAATRRIWRCDAIDELIPLPIRIILLVSPLIFPLLDADSTRLGILDNGIYYYTVPIMQRLIMYLSQF